MAVNGEPWLVGKDVAWALGYGDTSDVQAKHVDPEDKLQGDGVTIRYSTGREQHPALINEGGRYSPALSGKLPGAKRFKRWVTGEALPSIRRNGGCLHGLAARNGEKRADPMARPLALSGIYFRSPARK